MSIKIFACGDVVNSTSNKKFIDDELKAIVSQSDISVCNFEAPIKTDSMKAIRKAGPHVLQSKESIAILKESGFDFVSLANNHIYDYGENALNNTINELNRHGIKFVGGGMNFEQAYDVQIFEKDNIRVGFLAGCENEFGCLYEDQNNGGYAWILHHKIEDTIRQLKKEVDVVILVVHAGVENIAFPIKEWRDKYKRFCDLGADVVIGSHPHVPQGYEKYNNSMIFYSLGNFYFDTAGFQDKSDDSFSLVLDLDKDGMKNFDIIYHKKIDGQVCILKKDSVNFSLDYLNSLLKNDSYKKLNNKKSLELFDAYYRGYYENALDALPKNFTTSQILTYLVRKLFFRERNIIDRNLLLLHNIKIDSHRFVVQRALMLMNQKDE